MKRNFTLVLFGGLFLTLLFTQCRKSYEDVNVNYWLSQEQGQVAFSDLSCSFMAVETPFGYSVLRLHGSYTPYIQSPVYGDFESYGSRRFYDDASGVVFGADVVESNLSYGGALDAINYYCPGEKQKANAPESSKNHK